MQPLALHDFHDELGASFLAVADCEFVAHYGDWRAEHHALRAAVAWLDLSSRGRLVLLGADRQRMLNGQVTNDVRALQPGDGCYAALVNARARMVSDLNIHALPDELLLDFEPGLSSTVRERLEKFILNDDVRVMDAAPHYGLLSVQGPGTARLLDQLPFLPPLPPGHMAVGWREDPGLGLIYLVNHPRFGTRGADIYAPINSLPAVAQLVHEVVRTSGGRPAGWEALEIARVEAGIPRFGADMDLSTLPPEAGISERAISYSKGCYSGQEVIARIRTYGQVARALRGLRLPASLSEPPRRGTPLFHAGREVGQITSAVWSPDLATPIALAYVRRECNQPSTELHVGAPDAPTTAVIVALPFVGAMLAL